MIIIIEGIIMNVKVVHGLYNGIFFHSIEHDLVLM